MTEKIKATSQAHGLRYPFDEKPQLGEPIEVADGVFWARMDLPYTLDHINVWLLRDGAGSRGRQGAAVELAEVGLIQLTASRHASILAF